MIMHCAAPCCPQFLSVLMRPNPKQIGKLRKVRACGRAGLRLRSHCGRHGAHLRWWLGASTSLCSPGTRLAVSLTPL